MIWIGTPRKTRINSSCVHATPNRSDGPVDRKHHQCQMDEREREKTGRQSPTLLRKGAFDATFCAGIIKMGSKKRKSK